MDYGRCLKLSVEFGEFVASLHTLYLDAVVGFDVVHQRVLEYQQQIKCSLRECEEASAEFQDTCLIDYKQLCGEDYYVESVSPLMKQGEVKQRTERNGTNYIRMGHLCVVYAYAYWEDYLRKEIAIACGLSGSKKDLIKHDFWADMRIMRSAILHHNGVATPDFGRMKVLRWFQPGDKINLDFDKVKEMFAQMGDFRNCLHALGLPPHDTRFPSRDC